MPGSSRQPPDVAAVIARIRADANYFSEPPNILSSTCQSNRYSTTCRVKLHDSQRTYHLYIKQVDYPAESAQTTESFVRREYDILSRAHDFFKAYPGFQVITPVYASPVDHLLVTEECFGGTLEELISKSGKWLHPGTSRLYSAVHKAGSWLSIFQRHTQVDEKPFDAEALASYLSVRADRIEKTHTSRLPTDFCHQIRKHIDVLVDVPMPPVPYAGRHNDYAPHNIIVDTDGNIRVLDFTMYDEEYTGYDAINFMLKIENLKSSLLYSDRTVDTLIQNFFHGYYDSAPHLDPLPAMLTQFRFRLNRVLECVSARHGNMLSDMGVRSLLRRNVAWFYAELFPALAKSR